MAVVPMRARLVEQRQLGELRHMAGIVDAGRPQRGLGVKLLHHRGAREAISEAGGVAQQILDGDLAICRHELELAALLDADFRFGELGNEFGERVGDEKPPVFDQHHDGDRDDRLRHRVDTEDARPVPWAGRRAA